MPDTMSGAYLAYPYDEDDLPVKASDMQAAVEAISFDTLTFYDGNNTEDVEIYVEAGRIVVESTVIGSKQLAYFSDFSDFMAQVNARTTDPGTGDWWNDGGYIRGLSPVPSTVLHMENGIGLSMENGTVLNQEGA